MSTTIFNVKNVKFERYLKIRLLLWLKSKSLLCLSKTGRTSMDFFQNIFYLK